MHSGLRFGTPAGAACHKPCAVAFCSPLTDTQRPSSCPFFPPIFLVLVFEERADNTPLSIYLTLACNRVFQYASTRLPVSSFSSHTTKPCAMSESHQRPDGRRRSRVFKLRLAPPPTTVGSRLSNQLLGIALVRRPKERSFLYTDDPCLRWIVLDLCRFCWLSLYSKQTRRRTQNNRSPEHKCRASCPCPNLSFERTPVVSAAQAAELLHYA
jgi:hypothetical protein